MFPAVHQKYEIPESKNVNEKGEKLESYIIKCSLYTDYGEGTKLISIKRACYHIKTKIIMSSDVKL